jgi:hypothetical protein
MPSGPGWRFRQRLSCCTKSWTRSAGAVGISHTILGCYPRLCGGFLVRLLKDQQCNFASHPSMDTSPMVRTTCDLAALTFLEHVPHCTVSFVLPHTWIFVGSVSWPLRVAIHSGGSCLVWPSNGTVANEMFLGVSAVCAAHSRHHTATISTNTRLYSF